MAMSFGGPFLKGTGCRIVAAAVRPEITWCDQAIFFLYGGKKNSTAETSVSNFARV